MPIDQLSVQQSEAEVQDLTKRKTAAEAEIERLNTQLLYLADETATKLTQRRTAFKEKYKEKFKSVDLRGALLGMAVRWECKVFDATYFFEIPKGALINDLNRFLQNPIAKDTAGKEWDYNPILASESALLRLLSGIQFPGAQETSLKGKEPYQRLTAIRSLPDLLIDRLADQASNFENYLNNHLELELGN